jgi:hypothetical protein
MRNRINIEGLGNLINWFKSFNWAKALVMIITIWFLFQLVTCSRQPEIRVLQQTRIIDSVEYHIYTTEQGGLEVINHSKEKLITQGLSK